MATAKQIKANRANAKKSTGPTSAAGREKVSQNRTTHGLCGKFAVLPCEDQEMYDEFVDALMKAEKPADASEVELVIKMAEHSWRARRALRLQDACFSMESVNQKVGGAGQYKLNVSSNLDRYLGYHAAHDRAYRRAAQELMERKKQRHLAEIGFERKKQAEAEEKRKAEKHEVAQAIAKLNKQLLEIKAAKALASILPDDFTKNPDAVAAFASFPAFAMPQSSARERV